MMSEKSYMELGTPTKQLFFTVFFLEYMINHRFVNESFLITYLKSKCFIIDLKNCIDLQRSNDYENMKAEEVFRTGNVRESLHVWILVKNDARFAGYLTPLHHKMMNTIRIKTVEILNVLSQNFYSPSKIRRKTMYFSINDFFLIILGIDFKKEKLRGIWYFDVEIMNIRNFLDFNLFQGIYLDPVKSENDPVRKELEARLKKFVHKKKIEKKFLKEEFTNFTTINTEFIENFPRYLDTLHEDYEEIYGNMDYKSQYEIGDFRHSKIEPSTENLKKLVNFLRELQREKIDGSSD